MVDGLHTEGVAEDRESGLERGGDFPHHKSLQKFNFYFYMHIRNLLAATLRKYK